MSEFFDFVNRSSEKNIILDFKDIYFISRSCADEYIKLKLNSKKELFEENLSEEVKQMFNIAKLQFKHNLGIAA